MLSAASPPAGLRPGAVLGAAPLALLHLPPTLLLLSTLERALVSMGSHRGRPWRMS